MKLINLTLAGTSLLFSAAASHASLIAYDGLSGASIGSIQGVTTGSGWNASGWDSQNSENPYQVANTSPLTFGTLPTSADGNYISGGASYTNLGRALNTGSGSPFELAGYVSDPFSSGTGQATIDQGGVLWLSVLARRDSGGGDVKISLNPGNVAWSAPSTTISFGDLGGTWTINDTATNLASSKLVTNGQPALLVLRLDLNGASSSAHLWVNPVTLGGSDPLVGTADVASTGLAVSKLAFKALSVYVDNGANQGSLDEFRIGSTYADVTPVPEPSTYAAFAALAVLGLAYIRRRR